MWWGVDKPRWATLVETAKLLNVSLQTTKKEFVAFTEQQAKDFVKATVDFRDRMDANGPVKCTDLDIGLSLLVQYQASSSSLLYSTFFERCCALTLCLGCPSIHRLLVDQYLNNLDFHNNFELRFH